MGLSPKILRVGWGLPKKYLEFSQEFGGSASSPFSTSSLRVLLLGWVCATQSLAGLLRRPSQNNCIGLALEELHYLALYCVRVIHNAVLYVRQDTSLPNSKSWLHVYMIRKVSSCWEEGFIIVVR